MIAKRFVCLISIFVLTGCCWTDQGGTRHILVVGIGVVSVNNSKPEAACVTRTQVLGATVSGSRGGDVAIGYSSGFTTSVPDGAEDVRIEASQRPFAPIKIEVQKAGLKKTNEIHNPKESKQ